MDRENEKRKLERLEITNAKKEKIKEKARIRKLKQEIEEKGERLPDNVKNQIDREEKLERRLELKEIKESMWKLRHKEKKYNIKSQNLEKLDEIEDLEKKLDKINSIVEKMRIEEEMAEKEKKEKLEKIEKEREKRKKEKLSKELEKVERKKKAEMLGKRWEMLRWLTEFLKENQDKWELERLDREKEHRKKLETWEKAKRFEKIEILKRKWTEKVVEDPPKNPPSHPPEEEMVPQTQRSPSTSPSTEHERPNQTTKCPVHNTSTTVYGVDDPTLYIPVQEGGLGEVYRVGLKNLAPPPSPQRFPVMGERVKRED